MHPRHTLEPQLCVRSCRILFSFFSLLLLPPFLLSFPLFLSTVKCRAPGVLPNAFVPTHKVCMWELYIGVFQVFFIKTLANPLFSTSSLPLPFGRLPALSPPLLPLLSPSFSPPFSSFFPPFFLYLFFFLRVPFSSFFFGCFYMLNIVSCKSC